MARIVLQAETALSVGSGQSDVKSDSLVARDPNGLPYIPATSISGVLRHALVGVEKLNELFGFGGDEGKGSLLRCTSAHLMDFEGNVVDGLRDDVNPQDDFFRPFLFLPIRQHVSINEKGVAAKGGKFDQEVVYKGSRFCFEMELWGWGCEKEKEQEQVNLMGKVISQLYSPLFRLGGGTRNGLGELSVVSCESRFLNLEKEKDLNDYLAKSASLNNDFQYNSTSQVKDNSTPQETKEIDGWVKYEVKLEPEDFFLFGSGLGDNEADITPVTEVCVDYDYKNENKNGRFVTKTLIPATSIKGALAHRVAFYYNEKTGYVYNDKCELENQGGRKEGETNPAVKALFGCTAADSKKSERGHVIFADILLDQKKEKLLNHIAIDRFTGGVINGALYSEKANYGEGVSFKLTVYVDEKVLTGDIKYAFDEAWYDLCNGFLPLGGGTMRGHGRFKKIKE
jgi:CRISPR/Cas system CSM-associated protein Csm3 (group 7 of RAMP superfamily)